MGKRVFLYKDNSEDRDCCAYIEPSRFECGHYFSGLTLHGACYSGHDMASYEDIKTVLTETEYNKLVEFSKAIRALGSGITKGDERYQQGIKLCEDIQPIFDKLESEEAEEFFETIQEEEKEYLKEEYSLDDEDIQQIFDEYYLEYRDRAIVGYVFNDAYDCGYEEALNLGYVNNNDSIMERYFDFEKFGQDLANDDENYLELSDGRIVSLCY